MSRRVHLHVGTPKSGTSYLQDKSTLDRERLGQQGLDYLVTASGNHFEAALDQIGPTPVEAGAAARFTRRLRG